MEILKDKNEKPDFLSEVIIKIRPEIRIASIVGKGDPANDFNQKISQILEFLRVRGIKPHLPSFGIYYTKRGEVGIENVEWDVCIPLDVEFEDEGDVKFKVLPESKVISTTLNGGYELIGPALQYLEQVAETNGIKTRWPLTEIYHSEGKKPITELQYFVVD